MSSPRSSNSDNVNRLLQRSQVEKAMMLQEIQSLKQQLRATSKLVGIDEPNSRVQTWNKLLESNLRSGTLACLWCIKSLATRRMSEIFMRWRMNARIETLMMSSSSTSSSNGKKTKSATKSSDEFSDKAVPGSPQEKLSGHTANPSVFSFNPPISPVGLRIQILRDRASSPLSSISGGGDRVEKIGASSAGPRSAPFPASRTKRLTPSPKPAAKSLTPRYLLATQSSTNSQWGYYVNSGEEGCTGTGLELALDDIRLDGATSEQDGNSYKEELITSPRQRARMNRDREMDGAIGFLNDKGSNPFSPIREREKRRRKRISLGRSGADNSPNGSTLMLPTASARKKMVSPDEIARRKSGASPGTSSAPISRGQPYTLTPPRSVDTAGTPSRGKWMMSASTSQGQSTDDSAPSAVDGENGGSVGRGAAKSKTATQTEKAQLKLFMGDGEILKPNFDLSLRRY